MLYNSSGREYLLLYDNPLWRVFYTEHPAPGLPLQASHMICMNCELCKKAITSYHHENPRRLFIPESCLYRHKFHASCAIQALCCSSAGVPPASTSSSSSAPSSSVSGDLSEQRAKEGRDIEIALETMIGALDMTDKVPGVCPSCAVPLSKKDLQKLFKEAFQGVYARIVENDNRNYVQLCDDSKSKTTLPFLHSVVKNFFCHVTPFTRRPRQQAGISLPSSQ
jgi:hypothetical protein